MRGSIRIAAVFGLMATGCLGMQGDPGQTGTGTGTGTGNGTGTGGNNGVAQPPTARQLFDQNVLPMLGSCSTCHAGAGVAGPPLLGSSTDQTTWYGQLWNNDRFVNNDPTKSLLETHQHLATSKAPDLTTAQQKFVSDWLQQENVEHVLPPPPTAGGAQGTAELAKFAKCMAQADYTAATMNDIQNQDTTGDAGPCYTCHSTGLYVYLSKTAADNFTMMKVDPTLSKFAQASFNADGSFKDIEPSNRIRDRGSAPGHPPYVLSAARTQALTTFFNSTYTHYKAGNCP